MKKIEEMSFAQSVLIAFLLAGMYYFVFFDTGAGLDAEALSLKTKAEETRSLYAETSVKLKEGKQFENEVKELNATYSQLLEYLPEEVNLRLIRESIVQQVGIAGAKVVKVNPEPTRNKIENYEEFYLDIEVTGTYANLASFLARVTTINKILVFKKMSIQSNPSGGKSDLVLKGRIATYRYVEES